MFSKTKTSGGARSGSGAPKRRFDQNTNTTTTGGQEYFVSVRVATTCQQLRIWTPRLPTPNDPQGDLFIAVRSNKRYLGSHSNLIDGDTTQST